MDFIDRIRPYVRKGQRFKLTNGSESDIYIDIKAISMDHENLVVLAHRLKGFAKGHDLLAGMELGAVPIVTAVALLSKKSFLILRKSKRTTGTAKQIEGDFKPGQRVLLIEDVVTTGGTAVRSVSTLRDAGLVVEECVCVVLRDPEARKVLAGTGVELFALVDFDTLTRSK